MAEPSHLLNICKRSILPAPRVKVKREVFMYMYKDKRGKKVLV
jgi:hypothetical protein